MRGLNWSDERYVRAYCTDHADFLSLSFGAKGLYLLLRRKADRAGILPLGRAGLRSLAGLIGHASDADVIVPLIDELIELGWLEVSGQVVLIPEFIEAETAQASPAARKRAERERRRDLCKLSGDATVTESHASKSRQQVTVSPITNGHDSKSRQEVTPDRHANGHAYGHEVSHARKSPISDQIRSEDPPIPPRGGTRAPDENGEDPNLVAIRARLAAQPTPLQWLVDVRSEERLYAPVMAGGARLEDVLAAIDDAALKLGPQLGAVKRDDAAGLTAVERFVAGCVRRAKAERRAAVAAPEAPSAEQASADAQEVLEAYKAAYVTTGGYARYVVGNDDLRALDDALDAVRAADPEADAKAVLHTAIRSYLEDEFYRAQGHTLRRFAVVLRSEPARLLGRKKPKGAGFFIPLPAEDEPSAPVVEMPTELRGALAAIGTGRVNGNVRRPSSREVTDA